MTGDAAPQAQATPGQAAHDGWWDALPHRRNHPDYAPYDKESAEDRRAWDAAAAAVAAPLNAEIASLRARLEALAQHWNREYASETGWPSRCAAELREALEGGTHG